MEINRLRDNPLKPDGCREPTLKQRPEGADFIEKGRGCGQVFGPELAFAEILDVFWPGTCSFDWLGICLAHKLGGRGRGST